MEVLTTPRNLKATDLRELARAKTLLEHPGFAARVAGSLGKPIEQGFSLLPHSWQSLVNNAAKTALFAALNTAVTTMGRRATRRASNKFHKLLAGATGGIGGAFGLASLPVELPLSTTIMLRSIADIARSEGHDVGNAQTKLACLEVFALGGTSSLDDAAEGAYWAVRAVLAKAISDASAYLAGRKAVDQGAPAIVRLVGAIAARFGVVVSEQAAAKAVPILGAASGAAINVLFMDHFQDMARGHFIVRRLEAMYGTEVVREAYESIKL